MAFLFYKNNRQKKDSWKFNFWISGDAVWYFFVFKMDGKRQNFWLFFFHFWNV